MIEQTKGIIMGQRRCSAEDAFDWPGRSRSSATSSCATWPSVSSTAPPAMTVAHASGLEASARHTTALSSPSGRALFEVPLGELVEFLTRTYTAVPTGSESDFVDLDAELALLMWTDPHAGA